MGRYIVKVRDRYCEWSTVSDRPATPLMTEERFRAWYREEYGRRGMRRLGERMERVEEKGTSAFDEDGPEDVIRFNRAGPEETELTLDEIYERYSEETDGR